MSQLPRHAALSDADQQRLEQLQAKFADTWQARDVHDEPVSLTGHLPPSTDAIRLAALHRLIPIDLEQRWRRRKRVMLEDYLKIYPELGAAGDLPVELLVAEYKARLAFGDQPSSTSYKSRFPKQYPDLEDTLRESARGEPTLHNRGTLQAASSNTPTGKVSGTSKKIVPQGEGYQLLEAIGRGAYGEVWRATAPGGVEVAIKLIPWSSGDSLSQVELRALELMKRLRHAFLSQVQAYWLSGEHLYIVMDLADGSLQNRFDECRREGKMGIPAPELLGYIREAADALDYLHANQVLHRDVKPANILLSSGHARLADFGLARLFVEENADIGATLIGTPLYMGPEVWDRKVSPASDQYSLASTYVELRLGHPLFEAKTQMEVMRKHLTMKPDLKPLPAAEQRVLHKALSKDKADRYPTCGQFVAELQAAVLGHEQPGKAKISRRMVLATTILLPLLLGTSIYGLIQGGFIKIVPPPPLVIPKNCRPADGASEIFVAQEGVKYWDRIVFNLPNEASMPSGIPCTFVLVPQSAEQKLPSFYIQENKVWNELFSEFNSQHLKANPDLADPEKWPTDWVDRGADKNHGQDMPADAYLKHPVMRVGYNQAKEFAKWMGGSLPSPAQWDAAAGLHAADAKSGKATGPFRGDWNNSPKPKIAVDAGEQGTVPVGSSEDDVSPYGCRDMAGNGAEWTNEATTGGYSTVTLRGRDYHKDRPLLYSDLMSEDSTEIEKEDPYYTSDHIGFRVVLQPVRPEAK